MQMKAHTSYENSLPLWSDVYASLTILKKIRRKHVALAGALLAIVLSGIALKISFESPRTPAVPATGVVEGVGEEATTTSPQPAPSLGLHIANNGLTYIEGAKVVSISRSSMTVSSDWGGAELVWNVRLNGKTRFIASDGEKTDFENFEKGDYVNVTGDFISATPQLSLEAETVRSRVAKTKPVEPVKLGELD